MEHKYLCERFVNGVCLNRWYDEVDHTEEYWGPEFNEDGSRNWEVITKDLSKDFDYLLQECYNNRIKAYPSISELADILVKEDQVALREYRAECLAIKELYPKPIREPKEEIILVQAEEKTQE